MTSIVVELGYDPTSFLTLLANGTPAGPLYIESLGRGADLSSTQFWRLRPSSVNEALLPSTEYVLSGPIGTGGAMVELTRFTTAAGYDKVGGTPPLIRSLRLWRVRYALKEINAGRCVAAEYHGFLTVDYDPATIPNTPPESVIHTFSLSPKTGGSEQTFVYVGATPFAGLEPAGAFPAPIGNWHPELDPTREYCLSISAFGDGDRARLRVDSELVCTTVAQLSAEGAPPSPTGSSGAGSGCTTGGRADASHAALAVGALGVLLAVQARRSRARRR